MAVFDCATPPQPCTAASRVGIRSGSLARSGLCAAGQYPVRAADSTVHVQPHPRLLADVPCCACTHTGALRLANACGARALAERISAFITQRQDMEAAAAAAAAGGAYGGPGEQLQQQQHGEENGEEGRDNANAYTPIPYGKRWVAGYGEWVTLAAIARDQTGWGCDAGTQGKPLD